MNDRFNIRQSTVGGGRISHVAVDKRHTLGELRLVAKVHLRLEAIEDDHFIAEAGKMADDVRSNKPRSARDQYSSAHRDSLAAAAPNRL
jgi:hypothetical protein